MHKKFILWAVFASLSPPSTACSTLYIDQKICHHMDSSTSTIGKYFFASVADCPKKSVVIELTRIDNNAEKAVNILFSYEDCAQNNFTSAEELLCNTLKCRFSR